MMQPEIDNVYRHEVQYRRGELKKFIPPEFEDDEVHFILGKLPELWRHALEKVYWIDLKDEEVSKIEREELKPEGTRSLIKRVSQKMDQGEHHHLGDIWNLMDAWESEKGELLEKNKSYQLPREKMVSRYFKTFLKVAFDVTGGDTDRIIQLVIQYVRETEEIEGVTLYEKIAAEMADTYIHDMQYILDNQLYPLRSYEYRWFEEFEQNLLETIKNVIDPSIKSKLQKAHQSLFNVLETEEKKEKSSTKTNLKGRSEG